MFGSETVPHRKRTLNLGCIVANAKTSASKMPNLPICCVVVVIVFFANNLVGNAYKNAFDQRIWASTWKDIRLHCCTSATRSLCRLKQPEPMPDEPARPHA